jgi:hypothetical protein
MCFDEGFNLADEKRARSRKVLVGLFEGEELLNWSEVGKLI